MKKIFLTIPLFLIFFHLMYASDGPQIWTTTVSIGSGVYNASIVINPTTPAIMYAGSPGGGVYKSTDAGVTWNQSNSGLTSLTIWALAISPSNPNVLYAGTSAVGIFKTTDAAATWTTAGSGITQSPPAIQGIVVSPTDPNTAVCCVWDGVATLDATVGIFKTTNGGTLWAPSNTGFGANKNVLCLSVNPLQPNTIYAGTSFISPATVQTGPTYIYKSYDFGNTWVNSSTGFGTATTDLDVVRALSYSTLDTNTVICGRFFNTSNGGPWLTTNAGVSWTQKVGGINVAAFPGGLVRAICIRPGTNTTFYFGGDATTEQPGGVWHTTDGGTTWSDFNGGTLPNTATVRALTFRASDNTLFAGVTVGPTGIQAYTELPLGVHDPGIGAPKEFALNQNYPNPFNPSTVIEFAVPKTSFVTVKVYDILGKEVKTLVNETKQAGAYSLNFNASNLPSGVYLYKIIAGDFTATKKMMLIK